MGTGTTGDGLHLLSTDHGSYVVATVHDLNLRKQFNFTGLSGLCTYVHKYSKLMSYVELSRLKTLYVLKVVATVGHDLNLRKQFNFAGLYTYVLIQNE